MVLTEFHNRIKITVSGRVLLCYDWPCKRQPHSGSQLPVPARATPSTWPIQSDGRMLDARQLNIA